MIDHLQELPKYSTQEDRINYFMSLPESEQKELIRQVQTWIAESAMTYEPVIKAWVDYWYEVLMPMCEVMADIAGITATQYKPYPICKSCGSEDFILTNDYPLCKLCGEPFIPGI